MTKYIRCPHIDCSFYTLRSVCYTTGFEKCEWYPDYWKAFLERVKQEQGKALEHNLTEDKMQENRRLEGR